MKLSELNQIRRRFHGYPYNISYDEMIECLNVFFESVRALTRSPLIHDLKVISSYVDTMLFTCIDAAKAEGKLEPISIIAKNYILSPADISNIISGIGGIARSPEADDLYSAILDNIEARLAVDDSQFPTGILLDYPVSNKNPEQTLRAVFLYAHHDLKASDDDEYHTRNVYALMKISTLPNKSLLDEFLKERGSEIRENIAHIETPYGQRGYLDEMISRLVEHGYNDMALAFYSVSSSSNVDFMINMWERFGASPSMPRTKKDAIAYVRYALHTGDKKVSESIISTDDPEIMSHISLADIGNLYKKESKNEFDKTAEMTIIPRLIDKALSTSKDIGLISSIPEKLKAKSRAYMRFRIVSDLGL